MINFFKKLFIIAILFLAFFSIHNEVNAAGCTGTGNCYWVGGTGNTNNTAKWATTSGGATTGGLPGSTDNCIFDSASNAIAYTVTVNALLSCNDVSIGAPAAGAVTFAGTSGVDVYGSLDMPGGAAGITYTNTGTLNFRATSTGKTISTDGETITSRITIGATGGGWTLSDALVNTSASSLAFGAGTFDTGNFNMNITSTITSTGGNLTMTLGTSTITCGSWVMDNASPFTLTATSSTITSNGQFGGNGKTYGIVNIQTSPQNLNGANTFTTLTVTGSAGTDNITLNANQIVSGTFTTTGAGATSRLLISSSVKGTQRTITAGTITTQYTDWQDINGQGAGSWDLSAVVWGSGDCGGNSNITFSTAKTAYYRHSGGASTSINWNQSVWWTGSGGTGTQLGTISQIVLPQDTAILNSGSFTAASQTVVINVARPAKDINFTGVTNTPTLTTSTAASIFGSLTLVSGMTLTGSSQNYTFEGRGSHTITNAGKSWAKTIIINSSTGSYVLQDALTTSVNFVLSSGSFDANDFNVTFAQFTGTTGTLTMGNGTWTAQSGSTNMWNMGASVTVVAENSTISLTGTLTANRTFVGAGKTYYKVENNTAGAFALIISGSNTFSNEFKINAASAVRTVQFTTGTTQTIANMTRDAGGTNVITIDSTTTGTHALVKSGGGQLEIDYLNIQHSVATPSCTWFASTHSTNNQAVATAGSGWTFTAAASCGSRRFISI